MESAALPPTPVSTPAQLRQVQAPHRENRPSISTQTNDKATETLGSPAKGAATVVKPSLPLFRLALTRSSNESSAPGVSSHISEVSAATSGAASLEGIYKPPEKFGPATSLLIRAVQQGDKKGFRDILDTLSPGTAALSIEGVFIHCVEKDAVRGDNYQFIMDILKDKYPDIKPLLAEVVTKKSGPMDVLSSAGIRAIIKDLSAKNKITMPCVLCENHQELENELKKFVASPDTNMMFIVRNQTLGQNPPALHAVPILMEKNGSNYRCVITDSMAGGGPHAIAMAGTLKNLSKSLSIHCKILSCIGRTRQTQETNCPIYCIRDAIHFSKRLSENSDLFGFFEDAAKATNKKNEEGSILYFENLPASMMKASQKMSVVKEYGQGVYDRLKRRDHIKKTGDNEINAYIERKFLKYERFLIGKVIASSLN